MSAELKRIAKRSVNTVSAFGLAATLAFGNDAKTGSPQEVNSFPNLENRNILVVESPNFNNNPADGLSINVDNPVFQEQPIPEPTPSITLTPVGSSNIRRMPSTQSEILGATDARQRISSLGYIDAQDGYRWYYFRFNDSGAWIRADRVNNPGEAVEILPNLEGVLNIPALNQDGSLSNIRLLEANVNLALVYSVLEDIKTMGFPDESANPDNIALLAQRENSLIFTQTNSIALPNGGTNEAGSIFTIDIDEEGNIKNIGFFGIGQIKDIAASHGIAIEADNFSAEDMPDGFVRIGGNMIFYWRGAVEYLIEGLDQEDAINQNLMQIVGGDFSGRSFTIEGGQLVLSDGTRVDIDFSDGIGRMEIPEIQETTQETEELDYYELEPQPLPLPPIRSHTLEEIGLTSDNFNEIFTRDKMITFVDANALYSLTNTYSEEEVRNIIDRISRIPSLGELRFDGQPFIGVWEINRQINPHNIEFFVPSVTAYIAGITEEFSIDMTPNGGRPDEKVNFLNIWIPLTSDGASASLILQMREFYVRGWGTYRNGPGVGVSTDGLNGFLSLGYFGLNHYELDHSTIMEFIQNNIGSQVLIVKSDSVSMPRGGAYDQWQLILIDLLSDGMLDDPFGYPDIRVDYNLYDQDITNWSLIVSSRNFFGS